MTVRAKTDLGVLQLFQPSVRNKHSFIPFSLSTLHRKTPWEYTILLASARLCLSPTGLRPPRPHQSGWWQGSACTERGQRGSSGPGWLFGNQSSQTGTQTPLPGPGLCCSVPGHQPAACPFSPSPKSCTDAPDRAELSTAALSKPCSDHLSSPQTCGHESKFSWIFSQMSRPKTSPWA